MEGQLGVKGGGKQAGPVFLPGGGVGEGGFIPNKNTAAS
jgi:hypothetical protein